MLELLPVCRQTGPLGSRMVHSVGIRLLAQNRSNVTCIFQSMAEGYIHLINGPNAHSVCWMLADWAVQEAVSGMLDLVRGCQETGGWAAEWSILSEYGYWPKTDRM